MKLISALLLTFLAIVDAENDICGQLIHREQNGLILSHKGFVKRVYPVSYVCRWRIQAPPNQRIRLFVSYMSVEYETQCKFDHLDIYDGTNVSDSTKRIIKLCGGNVGHYIISSGNTMSIRFVSDPSIKKNGFSLRYQLLPKNALPSGSAVVSRRSSATTNKCPIDQFHCNDGLCIPNAMVCDHMDDCYDHSDEKGCPDHPPKSNCSYDEYECRGGKCIRFLFKCDEESDCPSGDDEDSCTPTAAPPTPSFKGRVSVKLPTTLPRGRPITRTAPYKTTITTRTPRTPMSFSPVTPSADSCGLTPISPDLAESRVVGGKVADDGSWPWIVAMRLFGGHACGGSILSKRWIMTAAHCFKGFLKTAPWNVVAGAHSASDTNTRKVQIRKLERILLHPKWNDDESDYDYALVKVNEDFHFNKRVQPICLPTFVMGGGFGCFVAGWGDTKGTGGEGLLKQAFVETFTHPQCVRFDDGRNVITKRMMCAGHRQGGRDTCQGDSGGPLMYRKNGRWEVHGITSFGVGCGLRNHPGFYARVFSVLPWIHRNTGVNF